ncbi:VOC family protein [Clostridium sp.]
MPILDSTEIRCINIPTENLQKTMKFYIDLGFETIFRTFNKDANEQVAFLRFKDIVIESNETLNVLGKLGSIKHISINISNINNAFRKCKCRGYDFLVEELQYLSFGENEVSFFILIGPSKETIEIYQKL